MPDISAADPRDVTVFFAKWSVLATAAGLPISMAPLMFVFAAKDATGNFAVGSVVVGSFVVGELVGASSLGVLSHSSRLRWRLAPGYLVSALAFAGVGVAATQSIALLIALAFVAGFAPSASPGTLQSVLLSTVPEQSAPRILVAARVQSTLVFMAGPALVGLLSQSRYFWSGPALCALSMMSAVLALGLLPDSQISKAATYGVFRTLRRVWGAWPIYAVGLAATFVVGLVDLVVAPLLVQRGESSSWVGLIAAGFFLVALLGSIAYGVRKDWPGTYASQSLVLTLVMGGGLCLAAAMPSVWGITLGLFVAGAGVATLMTIRTLSLRQTLPQEVHAAAFSLNYSMSCVSYILCAVVGGTTLASSTPSAALLLGAAAVVGLGLVAGVLESRRRLAGSRLIRLGREPRERADD